MFGDFLCISVLDDEEHDELVELARFSFSRNVLILISSCCMCFPVRRHALVYS